VALAAVCLGVEMLLLAAWRRRDKQALVVNLEGRAV
jgi:hypothetical protein